MSFSSKNIKDPYKFIDNLYTRLSGAYNDVKNNLNEDCYCNNASLFREQEVLNSILSWINNYKD